MYSQILILRIEKKLIENINLLWTLRHYGIIFLASMGTLRARDQCNRRNQKHIRNLRKRMTSQTLNMPLRTTEKIVEQGKVVKSGRGKYDGKQNCFSKIDDFWKNLTR